MLKQKMAIGALWMGAAKVVVNILSAASTFILARLLVPDDFGVVAIGLTVLTVITSVTELSLASALLQKSDLEEDHFHTAWTLSVLRAAIIAAAMAISAPWVADFYKDERLNGIIIALSAIVLLAGANNPKTILFLKKLEFWQEFVQTVGQKLFSFIICIGLAYHYQSFWALVAGTVASQLTSIIISYAFYPYCPKFKLNKWRELISFSAWLSFSQIINTISWRLDPLLIGHRLGSTVVGHYTVGDNLASLSTRELAGPIERTLFPGFSAINSDLPRLRRAYTAAQTFLTAVALPAGVGFACVAEPFVIAAMGHKWLPIVPVIQVMAAVFAVQTLGSPGHALAVSMGHTRWLFVRDLISFCIRMPLVVGGLYAGGIVGLLMGRAISAGIGIGLNFYIVKELLNIGMLRQLKDNMRSVGSALVMSMSLITIQHHESCRTALAANPLLGLCLLTLVGALIYTASTALLWAAARRPEGPESTLLSFARVFFLKISARIKG
jgi:lipopolysaccharide exporter